MRRLCATVLIFEVVVIGLAIPVAITIAHARPAAAGGTGGVLQVAVIATGVVVPAMYGLGIIFGALWLTAIWLGRRYQVP